MRTVGRWTADAFIAVVVLLLFPFLVIPLVAVPTEDDWESRFRHLNPDVQYFYVPLIFLAYVAILFLIRQYRRVAYGIAEVLVGIVGFFWVQKYTNLGAAGLSVFFQLAATVYIGIRGLDNIIVGVRARRNPLPKS